MPENAARDENHIPSLIAVDSNDGVSPLKVYADASTHRLLVSGVGATGPTGNFSGPGSSTTNAVVRFAGTSGATGKDSGVTIDNSNNMIVPGTVLAGNSGTEGTGITVAGVTYNSELKVGDIGGTFPAQLLVHKHSTVTQPIIGGARSNTDDDTHADVTNGMPIFSHIGAGFAGADYKLFGQIDISADDMGTISNTSAPGKVVVSVTPDTTITPTTALTIHNDKSSIFESDVVVNDGTKGIVLKDTAVTPHYWRITVNTTGTIGTADLGTTYP